jgi:hypothetical protein
MLITCTYFGRPTGESRRSANDFVVQLDPVAWMPGANLSELQQHLFAVRWVCRIGFRLAEIIRKWLRV